MATKGEDANPSSPATPLQKERSEESQVNPTEQYQKLAPRMKKYDCEEPTQLTTNEKFLNRWHIYGLIGKGGYGEIYQALDCIRGEDVAIKVEPKKRKGKLAKRMILEQHVMFKMQGKPHVPVMFSSGYTERLNFMVMQILSINIGDIKKSCPHRKMGVTSMGRIVHQTITALRDLHELGYVHRDVKPANMCFGIYSHNLRKVYLLDFGLVRRYKEPNGEWREPRARAGFRGTTRYVSIRVHRRNEQTPCDDLSSVMYTAYELLCGDLPWKNLEKADEVLQMKESMTDKGVNKEMFTGASSVLMDFFKHVIEMDPLKEPTYDKLIECVKQLYAGKAMDDPYEWDEQSKLMEEGSEDSTTR